MNIFFDTEFTGLHKNTTLISLGMIAENGRTFYAEFTDYDKSQLNLWIQENVINNLKFTNNEVDYADYEKQDFTDKQFEGLKSNKQNIKIALLKFLKSFDEPIQLIADVAHYDMMLFVDIFGSSFDLPNFISPYCHDINQDITLLTNTISNGLITDLDAFNLSREQLLLDANVELPQGDKHNALYDAKVIKLLFEIIKEFYEGIKK